MSRSQGNAMMEGRQVVSLFLAACPEFAPAWEEDCRYWELDLATGMELKTASTPYPSPYPQLYTSLSWVVCQYVMEHYSAGQTNYFPAIFDLVERCIVEGDGFVSEWAVIGVLEDLQGAVLRKELPDDSFFLWMGPQSKAYWAALHRLWGTGPLGADDESKSHA